MDGVTQIVTPLIKKIISHQPGTQILQTIHQNHQKKSQE
jgi:hypothetical protein